MRPRKTRPHTLGEVHTIRGVVANGLRHAKRRAIDGLRPLAALSVKASIGISNEGVGILVVGMPLIKLTRHRPRATWRTCSTSEANFFPWNAPRRLLIDSRTTSTAYTVLAE